MLKLVGVFIKGYVSRPSGLKKKTYLIRSSRSSCICSMRIIAQIRVASGGVFNQYIDPFSQTLIFITYGVSIWSLSHLEFFYFLLYYNHTGFLRIKILWLLKDYQ